MRQRLSPVIRSSSAASTPVRCPASWCAPGAMGAWRRQRSSAAREVFDREDFSCLIAAMAAASSPDIPNLARKLRGGDRATLARAITLVESKRADHQQAAHALVQQLLAETGKAVRVGITGSPGVGKSTTIDALGTSLTEKGHK